MKETKRDKNRVAANIIRFSGLGLQIALIIGGGSYLGKLLDEQYPMDKNWFTLGMVLLSVAVAMWYAVRTLNNFNKE